MDEQKMSVCSVAFSSPNPVVTFSAQQNHMLHEDCTIAKLICSFEISLNYMEDINYFNQMKILHKPRLSPESIDKAGKHEYLSVI